MTELFTFRPATLADAPRLTSLDARCFPPGVAYAEDFMQFLLSNGDCHSIVAEEGVLAGFIIVAMTQTHAGEVVTIDIESRFRRRKLGTMLMDRGEEWVRRRGGEWMYLEVDQDNAPALGMYRERGYEVVREFDENGIARFRMMKAL